MPQRNFLEEEPLYRKLKDRGYKITIAREAILEALSKTDKHLSSKDIYSIVNKKFPVIGLTTVYRTLDVLSSAGLVSRFDFGDGQIRYELTKDLIDKGHHHHLVCLKCNRVIDYNDFIDDEIELLRETETGLSKKYNFEITNHLIQFYGLCDKCLNK